MTYNFTIHPETLKEFLPKAKVAAVLTIIGNRMILGEEWKKIEKEKHDSFREEIEKKAIFIREMEKEISQKMIDNGISKGREWFESVYYLTTPLNDLYNELSYHNQKDDHYLKSIQFFRDDHWWSGPLGIQEIADSVSIPKKEAENILRELEDKGFLIKNKFSISSGKHSSYAGKLGSYWYHLIDEKFVTRCREHYKRPQIIKQLILDEAIDGLGIESHKRKRKPQE